jgi:hypothetical protein
LFSSPAGHSIRFEPGERKTVTLVDIAGTKEIRGGNNICNGPVTESHEILDKIRSTLIKNGYADESSESFKPDLSVGQEQETKRIRMSSCEGYEV